MGQLRQVVRPLCRVQRRWYHGKTGDVPGSSLPVDINNKFRACFYFAGLCGTGFLLPILAVKFQLWKSAGGAD